MNPREKATDEGRRVRSRSVYEVQTQQRNEKREEKRKVAHRKAERQARGKG